MRTRQFTCFVTGVLALVFSACAGDPGLIMKQEVTGVQTNCYLVYEPQSREAALIDVGGPIDTLLAHITDQRLTVKYFLVTHGHPDHVVGLPDLLLRFPQAQMFMHRADFDDMQLIQDWLIDELGPATTADLAENPAMAALLAFDVTALKKPDIFVSDTDTITLGKMPIRIIHSPGHSPGSVCYHAGDMLFSGDVLFHRSVGRVDLPNSSAEDQGSSIRGLYSQLPDSTRVYPGHGEPTDIGSERVFMASVSLDGTP